MDTNRREIQGQAVHMTGVCELVRDREARSAKPRFDIVECMGIEFRNPTAPAEQMGWLKFVQNYRLNGLKGRHGSVALLTDHDMGNIQAYNRREKRIAGVAYLPPEFTLVYACGDRAQSQFANQTVGAADHLADRLLDMVEKNFDCTDALQPGDSKTPCEFWRWHEPKGYRAYDSLAEGKQRAPARVMLRTPETKR